MADRQQIQGWLDKLRAGTLVEADLQQALDHLERRNIGRQLAQAAAIAISEHRQHRR